MERTLEPIVTRRQALIVTSDFFTMERMVTNPYLIDGKAAFAARLNEALDDIGIPPKNSGRQQKAAELFGLTQKGARKWLEAESIPVTHKVPDIVARINKVDKTLAPLRAEWLLFGVGPKRETHRVMQLQDEYEVNLIQFFRTTDERGREELLRSGELLSKVHPKANSSGSGRSSHSASSLSADEALDLQREADTKPGKTSSNGNPAKKTPGVKRRTAS